MFCEEFSEGEIKMNQITSLNFDECKGKVVRSIETSGCETSMIVLFADETVLQVAIGDEEILEANSHVCFAGFSVERLERMGFAQSIVEAAMDEKRAAMDENEDYELKELARLKAKYELS